MEFRFLPVLATAIILVFGASHAALPAEMYWRSVFPNTPMPKALKSLLLPAAGNTKTALAYLVKDDNITDNNDHYNEQYASQTKDIKGNTKTALADMVKDDNITDNNDHYNEQYASQTKDIKGNTKTALADMVKDDNITDNNDHYNEQYASQTKDIKGNTKTALADMVKGDNITDNNDHYNEQYASQTKDIKGDKDMAKNKDLYFFESELRPGRKMNIQQLTKKPRKGAFLPRAVAESIPFSTQKFPEILKYFSLEAKSAEANLLKGTIESCERPALKGEEKYCATSLESFVDLAVSKLGKNIQILSNELEKETQNQEFTVGQGVKMMGESEIVCHKKLYAYAVFLCHSIDKTAVYRVPLVGADGTRARALAVCHRDTSAWNPNHLAFQILKVKPGTVPICHFLVRETLVWVPN